MYVYIYIYINVTHLSQIIYEHLHTKRNNALQQTRYGRWRDLAFASFTTEVQDVFVMTLDDLDDEEKDRLWVSWQLGMLEEMPC